MAAYRDELDAARTRIRVLEAQLHEQRAANDAQHASMVARQTELEAIESEIEQLRSQRLSDHRPSRSLGWEALATLGVAALLVSVGVSEAIDRAERARSALRHERLSWKLERTDKDFALASLRAENQRLRRLLREQDEEPDLALPVRDPFQEYECAEPAETPAETGKDTLMQRLRSGEASTHEVRLLRVICQGDGDTACYDLATTALKLRLSMGQDQ